MLPVRVTLEGHPEGSGLIEYSTFAMLDKVSGKALKKRFEKAGWQLKGVTGSHHIMMKGTKRFSIPIHGSKDVSKGVLHAALKLLAEEE